MTDTNIHDFILLKCKCDTKKKNEAAQKNFAPLPQSQNRSYGLVFNNTECYRKPVEDNRKLIT